MQEKYFSQYQQDQFLDKVLFNKKKNGFFIDIGAHDGVSISNSLFFEKYRKWEGICVEPNPIVYKELIKNRTSLNLNVCIGNSNEIVRFAQIEGYSEMLSGVTSKYDERHLSRIKSEIIQKGGEIKSILVQMLRLDTIKEIENRSIDFISIDTEGNEFDIIKSIDFKNVNIKAIVIENNYKDKEFEKYLKSSNFILLTNLQTDEIYIHKNEYKFIVRYNLTIWNLKNRMNYYLNRILKINKMLSINE